jgi:hypothetical protein
MVMDLLWKLLISNQNQHIDFATPLRKVDLDLAEVGFHTLARLMIQGDKSLTFGLSMTGHKPSNGRIASLITVFIAESFKRRMMV